MSRARSSVLVLLIVASLGALAWGVLVLLDGDRSGDGSDARREPSRAASPRPQVAARDGSSPLGAPTAPSGTPADAGASRIAQDAPAPASLPTFKAAIRGRIEGEDGAPMEGAAVEIAGAGSVASDAAGLFSVEVPADFSGDVDVHHRGFASAHLPSVAAGDQIVCVLVRGARLSGTVLRAGSEEPIAGAEVRVRIGSVARTATSDAAGGVTLEDLPYGSAEVTVSARGYELRVKAGVSISASTPPRRWLLEPGTRLTGRVVDSATRRPIAGARVQYFAARETQSDRDTLSDGEGRFDLGIVGLKEATVLASAPGYEAEEYGPRSFDSELQEFLWCHLDPAATLSGRVIDAEGSPLAGCELEARSWREPLRTVSDAHGEFVFEPMSPRSLTILARHPRCGAIQERATLAMPGTSIVIQMPAPASIDGVIRSAAGPVSGAHVVLLVASRPVRALGCGDHRQVADDQGRFLFAGLSAGTYLLAARAPGLLSDFVEIAVGEGQRSTLAMTLREGSTIAGEVVADGGRAIPGATIRAAQVQKAGDDPSAKVGWTWPFAPMVTDERGRFTLLGVRELGEVTISASAPGHAPAAIEAAAGQGVVILLRSIGLIRGRVVDAATRKPIPDFSLDLEAEPSTRSAHGVKTADGVGIHALADAEGRFCITRLAAGAYTIRAHADEYLEGEWQQVTTADAVRYAPEWELALAIAGGCAGAVVDQSGAPAADIPVFLVPLSPVGDPVQGTSGADGSFRFPGIQPGRYRIGAGVLKVAEVASEDFEQPRSSQTTIVLRAPALRRLVAHVRSSDGRAVPDARVWATALRVRQRVKRVTDRTGDAVFAHLLPADYSVSAAEGGRYAEARVALGAADAIDEIELLLQ